MPLVVDPVAPLDPVELLPAPLPVLVVPTAEVLVRELVVAGFAGAPRIRGTVARVIVLTQLLDGVEKTT